MSEKDQVAEAIGAIVTQMNATAPIDREEFLVGVMVMSIAAMRGMKGDQFTREFLEAALTDLDKPSRLYVRKKMH